MVAAGGCVCPRPQPPQQQARFTKPHVAWLAGAVGVLGKAGRSSQWYLAARAQGRSRARAVVRVDRRSQRLLRNARDERHAVRTPLARCCRARHRARHRGSACRRAAHRELRRAAGARRVARRATPRRKPRQQRRRRAARRGQIEPLQDRCGSARRSSAPALLSLPLPRAQPQGCRRPARPVQALLALRSWRGRQGRVLCLHNGDDGGSADNESQTAHASFDSRRR